MAPFEDCATHAPPEQVAVGPHWALVVHWVGQVVLVPSQTYGAQAGTPVNPFGATAQVPFAAAPRSAAQTSQPVLHAVLQQTPSAQAPLWHCCAEVQAVPFFWAPTHSPFWQNAPAAHCELCVHDVGHDALVAEQR